MAKPFATSAPDEPTNWSRADALGRFAPLIVFVVAFAAFAPALSQGFAALDDDYNFLYQTQWAGLSNDHVSWMWNASLLGHWQPLSWMSLGFDFVRSGCPPLPPGPPHVVKALLDQHEVGQTIHQTNLALHALGAVFLYFALRRLLALAFETARSDATITAAALLGALLHVVHPLRVESVVWATERRDVLSGMFLCAALAAWLRSREDGAKWSALSLACLALSLLSKAWGMTFPVVLLALEVFPLRRFQRDPKATFARLLLEKWPYFALALVAGAVAAWAQAHTLAVVSWAEHGPLQRTAQAAWGLVFYVGKTLWPVELSPMYLLERDLDPLRPMYLFAFALVGAASASLVWLWKRRPGLVVSMVVYAVVVSPVLGFLQSGSQRTADRYSYLATIPFAALAGAALVVLGRRRAALVWLGALPVPVLFALSWQQTKIWSDPVLLWEHVVAVEPDNYFGQHNLAAQLQQRALTTGDPNERSALLRRAVEHDVLSVKAHPLRGNEPARHNLGLLHSMLGEAAEAEAAWRECVAVVPDNLQCLSELRRVMLARGDLAGVKTLFESAIAALPPNFTARTLYAETLTQQGDRPGAERVWRAGLALGPNWAEGLTGLGELVLSQGKFVEAEGLLRQALKVDGRNVGALVALGRALRGQRKVQEAEQCWQNALLLVPDHPQANAYLQKSRADAAQGR